MYPKFNFYSAYNQYNHMYAPKYFDWVKDGSGVIDFFSDANIVSFKSLQKWDDNRVRIAMLIEPRTIQPTVYKWIEDNYKEFDLIFSHDKSILNKCSNAYPIIFMNWYKTYDVPKTKKISMVCSDKIMCEEHKTRQWIADKLGSKVDHYGTYKGGYVCDYYECRAEYMFEVVVDNNWTGHWLSEKLANPIASKTIPIYLGGEYVNQYFNSGILIAKTPGEVLSIVSDILSNPEKKYQDMLKSVEYNYNQIEKYHVFEDWFWINYHDLLEKTLEEKRKK